MKLSYLLILTAMVVALIVTATALKTTDEPEFCSSCHVMEDQAYSWAKSAHKAVKCVECHLPHENAFEYYYWKARLGLNDYISFYFYSVDGVSLKHGEIVKKNCFRCHSEVLSLVNVSRDCWNCHKVVHTPGVRI
ncbi:MAG: NapC/NirT family cytochrome c [Archaeoglobaceae archaeon]